MIERFYDNSQVSQHRDCARKYMFRYVYHLVRDFSMYEMDTIPASKTGAAFGTAWHAAMDVVWKEIIEHQNQNDREVTQKALVIWEHTWLKDIPKGVDTGFRTKDTALEMLDRYIKERRQWLSRMRRLIASERPFAVPLRPDDAGLWYCGRLDKLVEMDDGLVYVVDHKTTSQYDTKSRSKVRNSFIDSFSPNSQIDGYSFGAMMIYGPHFGGAFIDGALVHKNERSFPLLPISRINDQLDAWLWETLHEIERIEVFKAEMATASGDKFLKAFPKNTSHCFQYGPCAYLDLCRAWANPVAALLNFPGGAPDGYKQEIWSPFAEYHLDQIKLVEEKK